MTRVLHLTRDLPPRATGGISTAVGGLVRASMGGDLPAAALSFDAWRPRRQGGAAAVRDALVGAPVLRLSSPEDLPEARAFAASWGPELLAVHHGMLWEEAATLRAALGIPALLVVHVDQAALNAVRGLDEETMSLAAQRRALAEADAVVAPSRAAAEALTARWGRAVGVGPLGIDDRPAARASRERREAEEFAGPPLVAALSRFDAAKGTGDLLEAAPALLEAGVRLVVAGGVPENRRAERRWRARFEALGAREAAVGAVGALGALPPGLHLAGWLDDPARDALLAAADLVLVPSHQETFGQVVQEAMLFGAPVLAADCGGPRELVEPGLTGALVPPGDPTALAEAAIALLDAPERLRALGRAGAARVVPGRFWASLLPAWAELYRALARLP